MNLYATYLNLKIFRGYSKENSSNSLKMAKLPNVSSEYNEPLLSLIQPQRLKRKKEIYQSSGYF